MSTPTTRRSPRAGTRAEVTRRRIIDAATMAFATRGFEATSVSKDVLEPAGVSTGSFYHQFADKAELFAAVVGEAATAAQQAVGMAMREGADVDPRTRATGSWTLLLHLVDEFEPLFRIHMRERANPDPDVAVPLDKVKATWAATLRASALATSAPPGHPSDVASEVVIALALGVIQTYLDRDRVERVASRPELAAHLADFTVGGLVALRPDPTQPN
jgi:AcrR family transcriptional regulator